MVYHAEAKLCEKQTYQGISTLTFNG